MRLGRDTTSEASPSRVISSGRDGGGMARTPRIHPAYRSYFLGSFLLPRHSLSVVLSLLTIPVPGRSRTARGHDGNGVRKVEMMNQGLSSHRLLSFKCCSERERLTRLMSLSLHLRYALTVPYATPSLTFRFRDRKERRNVGRILETRELSAPS